MGQAAEVDLIGQERMKSLNGPVTPERYGKGRALAHAV